MSTTVSQERQEQNYKLRKEFWEKIGKVDSDVLSYLINPTFAGSPSWPDLRRAYTRIVTPTSVILATDGLSDEYTNSENPNNGFEIELYVEFNDPMYKDMSISELKEAWIFQLLEQASLNAAHTGAFKNALDKYGVVSSEFYDVVVPEAFSNNGNSVGVLLGVGSVSVPAKVKLAATEVSIACVTLLTSKELEHIVKGGSTARSEIIAKLQQSGNNNLSSLSRPSCV